MIHRDRERTCVAVQKASISRSGPAECFQGDLELVSYRAKKRHSHCTIGSLNLLITGGRARM